MIPTPGVLLASEQPKAGVDRSCPFVTTGLWGVGVLTASPSATHPADTVPSGFPSLFAASPRGKFHFLFFFF